MVSQFRQPALKATWYVCRHLAASEGSYKVTEWLLSEQADINSLDRFKRTPLEVYSAFMLLECCSFKSELVCSNGSMQDAVRGDFNELSKLLIDHGGKVWTDGQVMQL